MAKYDPLRDRLRASPEMVDISFQEVADLVGGLPDSAYRYTAWWSNNDHGHVEAIAWLSAGYRVENVDLASRRVRFNKG